MKISKILLTGAFLMSVGSLSAQCPGGQCGNNYGNNKFYQQRADNEQTFNSTQPKPSTTNIDARTDVSSRVRNILQGDSSISLNGKNIQISADSKGNVSLSGTVDSTAEKSKIEALVKRVDGVRAVTNNLTTSN